MKREEKRKKPRGRENSQKTLSCPAYSQQKALVKRERIEKKKKRQRTFVRNHPPSSNNLQRKKKKGIARSPHWGRKGVPKKKTNLSRAMFLPAGVTEKGGGGKIVTGSCESGAFSARLLRKRKGRSHLSSFREEKRTFWWLRNH